MLYVLCYVIVILLTMAEICCKR